MKRREEKVPQTARTILVTNGVMPRHTRRAVATLCGIAQRPNIRALILKPEIHIISVTKRNSRQAPRVDSRIGPRKEARVSKPVVPDYFLAIRAGDSALHGLGDDTSICSPVQQQHRDVKPASKHPIQHQSKFLEFRTVGIGNVLSPRSNAFHSRARGHTH